MLPKILSLAQGIRSSFEQFRGVDPSLLGYCGRASAQLLLAANEAGIKGVEIHYNNQHAFNVFRDGRNSHIIDITATQFGIKDKVFVRSFAGRKRDFHETWVIAKNPNKCPFVWDSIVRSDRRKVKKCLGNNLKN